MSQRMEQRNVPAPILSGSGRIGRSLHRRCRPAAISGLGLLLAACSLASASAQGTDAGVSAATKKLLASPLEAAPASRATTAPRPVHSKAPPAKKAHAATRNIEAVSRHEGAAKSAEAEPIDSHWRARWIARWKTEHAGKAHAKASAAKAGKGSAGAVTAHSSVKSAHAIRKSAPAKRSEPTASRTAARALGVSAAAGNAPRPAEIAAKSTHAANSASSGKAARSNAAANAVSKTETKPAAATAASDGAINPDVLSKTRSDGFGGSSANKPMDSPLSAVGDGWKLILYLIPILLVTVGAMRVLRAFHERNGKLPVGKSAFPSAGGWGATPASRPGGSLLNALMGSFHLNNARSRGGGSIRLVESVPVGNANLHLIEVRGRVLLIGATGTGVSLLTEFEHEGYMENGDFRALLQAAASDLDTLDAPMGDLPAEALVGTLEEEMRDTSDALRRRARRLRTVQEEEDECA